MRSSISPEEPSLPAELRALGLLDRPPPVVARIVRMVRDALDAPMAFAAVIDSGLAWPLAMEGLTLRPVARAASFTHHALLADGPLVIEDVAADPQFRDVRLVAEPPRVRACAAAPIATPSGQRIGALCALDTKPGRPDAAALRQLTEFAMLLGEALVLARDAARPADDLATARRRTAQISHDMRTPLGHIIGFAELLCDDAGVATPAQRDDYLAIIRTGANDLKRMLDAGTEPQTGSDAAAPLRETVDLADLLLQLANTFAREAERRGQTIVFVDRDDDPDRRRTVTTDPTALRRAVGNLVANACAHAGAGARIEVALLPAASPRAAAIEVRDDGVGLPDNVMAEVGRPYLQGPSPNRGAGLGLSNVVDIARAMDWTFTIANRSDGGVAARIELPLDA